MADKALGQDGLKKVFALIKSTYAGLDSPEFTGVPKADTAASGTSTTQIATTEFVMDEMQKMLSNVTGNVTTFADLPTTATTGEVYHVDSPTVGTGTPENPQYPAGYYKFNGTDWEYQELSTSTVEFFTDSEIEDIWNSVLNPTP